MNLLSSTLVTAKSPTRFKRLTIQNWKQFGNLEINFHEQLTILTGVNGAGKTTILNLLAQHFGWETNELATPAKDLKSGLIRFFTRFFKSSPNDSNNVIGNLEYQNKHISQLSVPDTNRPSYRVKIENKQKVNGFNIHYQRPVFRYAEVKDLTNERRTFRNAFDLLIKSSISSKEGMLSINEKNNPNFYIKETILIWSRDVTGEKYLKGYEKVLYKILPTSLGFKKLEIRSNEIVVITSSGDFMIEAVSGGISTLIYLSWTIYLISIDNRFSNSILIDEAETHLHASMQRELLPNLIEAFPKIQFIVSTHSPLIIGSVKESYVFALKYCDEPEGKRKITSELLNLENMSKTATEIFHEVLGVSFTMPIWIEKSLNEIVNRYSTIDLNKNSFQEMRKDLSQLGLENLMPIAMEKVLDQNDKNN